MWKELCCSKRFHKPDGRKVWLFLSLSHNYNLRLNLCRTCVYFDLLVTWDGRALHGRPGQANGCMAGSRHGNGETRPASADAGRQPLDGDFTTATLTDWQQCMRFFALPSTAGQKKESKLEPQATDFTVLEPECEPRNGYRFERIMNA